MTTGTTTGRTTGPVVRAGDGARDGLDLQITPESAGWGYSGLAVLTLEPGERRTWSTGAAETLVLPLAGSCTINCGDHCVDLAGRPDVFRGPTDFAYAPRDAEIVIGSETGGRFALPSARCERRLDLRYQPADRVPVELRGVGREIDLRLPFGRDAKGER